MWKSKVPTKISFFISMATLGQILTNDNLWKRRLFVIDWCCMCKRDGETSHHLFLHCSPARDLFLHCSLAKDLWSTLFSLFGVARVMPSGVVELLAYWSDKFNQHRNGAIWNISPHCLM